MIIGGWRQTSSLERFIEEQVDFGHFEAGERNIKSDINQALQFQDQQAAIPARFLGQPIVGDDVGSFFGVTKM